jgi:cellulose synthase/poly-beta-1,6-N-acetylglucosamine synthase-like glycosyltransferase
MDKIIILYSIMFFFGIYFLLLFVILKFRYGKTIYDYPEPKKFPTITLITPAYNEEDSITNTIKALLEVEYTKDKKEILLVNDGSSDKTLEIMKKFANKYSEIKILDKKNSGKSDSLNQAIKIAKGELIAVVDADSSPAKDSLYKMVGFFEQDEKMAAVTSKVFVKNKNKFMEKFQDIDYRVIAWSRKILDFIDCVYVTNGPLSIYRKSIVKKVGGFDTKIITEDIELTWNLMSKGYKTKMSYSAIAYTSVPSTINKWIKQRIRWNIGGFQTLAKYKNYFLKENLFGYFVITYVSLSFFLSFLGIFLMLRFFYYSIFKHFFVIPYLFKGYNPFLFMDFGVNISIMLILGVTFLIFSFFYHKIALHEASNNNTLTIFKYIFFYRPLYMIPLIISIYKLIRGEIGWYTK